MGRDFQEVFYLSISLQFSTILSSYLLPIISTVLAILFTLTFKVF